MCGRFTLAITGAPLAEMLRLPVPQANLEPRFNIAPSQVCQTIVAGSGSAPLWREQRWGLRGAHGLHINARSETVAELPRFRDLYADPAARCLVPADGYYEWRREGRIQQPYYFTLPARRPFCFAGLAEDRSGDGTFLILTGSANESSLPIHDRMPVILAREEYERWLCGPADEAGIALEGRMSPEFEPVPVSQRVNDVGHDDPSCVEPGRTQSVLFDL